MNVMKQNDVRPRMKLQSLQLLNFSLIVILNVSVYLSITNLNRWTISLLTWLLAGLIILTVLARLLIRQHKQNVISAAQILDYRSTFDEKLFSLSTLFNLINGLWYQLPFEVNPYQSIFIQFSVSVIAFILAIGFILDNTSSEVKFSWTSITLSLLILAVSICLNLGVVIYSLVNPPV